MVIASIKFLLFCLAAVALFLVFPKKYRWISLLISSVIFYLYSAREVIVFIIITSLNIWLLARKIDAMKQAANEKLANVTDKQEKKKIKAEVAKKRKMLLQVGLIINLGILIAFKIFNYFNVAIVNILSLLKGGEVDFIAIAMPLGISYYTFASVGYILDVYWNRYGSEKNYARFLLFAIYFPHILQGPISRYNKLGQELKKPELRLRWNNFVVGMERILLGCFKKLVIADRASIFVSSTLKESGLHGSVYLLAMILDGIQIYSDFSGYMDIVSGLSLMFDVELEQNFNHPFLAKSIPEFWRRWHMSLGGWFKDYVYYPISVSKLVKNIGKKTKNWNSKHLRNVVIVIIPIMVTWLLTGLWHGTGAGYVAWGIYYGTLITLSVTFSDDIQLILQKCHVNTECFSYRCFQTIKIFCVFMGGRFLATQMPLAHRIEIGRSMLTDFIAADFLSYGLGINDFIILMVGILIIIAIGVIEQKEDIYVWFNKQNKPFCAIVIYILFFAIFILGIYGTVYSTSDFMYQQF